MGIVDVGFVGLIWYIYSNERPKISDMSIHITWLKCARLYSPNLSSSLYSRAVA